MTEYEKMKKFIRRRENTQKSDSGRRIWPANFPSNQDPGKYPIKLMWPKISRTFKKMKKKRF